MHCAWSILWRLKKKELQEILKDEIGGIQRVPAMIFFDQEKTTVDLGLG